MWERRRHRCGTGAAPVRHRCGTGAAPVRRFVSRAERRRTAGGPPAERRRICGAASSGVLFAVLKSKNFRDGAGLPASRRKKNPTCGFVQIDETGPCPVFVEAAPTGSQETILLPGLCGHRGRAGLRGSPQTDRPQAAVTKESTRANNRQGRRDQNDDDGRRPSSSTRAHVRFSHTTRKNEYPRLSLHR